MSRFATRVDQVRSLLRLDLRGSDAVFVTRNLATIRYLTGFSGSNATAVLSADAITLVTDGRYRDQARAEVMRVHNTDDVNDVDIVIERDAMAAVMRTATGVVLVDPGVSSGDVERLREAGFTVALSEEELRTLRQIKDPNELAALEAACAITAQAMIALAESIRIGQTEVQIARRIETLFADLGAQDRAFATIVASGPHSAIPHHRPTTTAIAPGDLLVIDCGAMVDGYHADMTRTFVVGAPAEPWQVEIHSVVLAAQQAGITAAEPGVAAASVDEAARAVIASAGFADAFTHGTGHGVGLEIHEPPMVMATSADTINAGSPITVEPGIYLPGRGGVRIEDTIVVGDTTRVLTDAPRDLIVVG